MIKLIELEHSCCVTATLELQLPSIIKCLQQKKTTVQKDDEMAIKIWIRLPYLGNKGEELVKTCNIPADTKTSRGRRKNVLMLVSKTS